MNKFIVWDKVEGSWVNLESYGDYQDDDGQLLFNVSELGIFSLRATHELAWHDNEGRYWCDLTPRERESFMLWGFIGMDWSDSKER